MEPLKVTEADLRSCADLEEPTSAANAVIVPWVEKAVEAFNECAARQEKLAGKVREHNERSTKGSKDNNNKETQ